MSVYTSVSQQQLEQFLQQYDVGALEHFEGISAGIENTNYFVDTRRDGQLQRFVLTLFETYTFEEMPYFLNLMQHLSRAGVPSARPIPSLNGELLLRLNDKPAALVERLNGGDIEQPEEPQVTAIGRAMAQMHLAGKDFSGHRDNCRSFAWWEEALERLADKLPSADSQLIRHEIDHQRKAQRDTLPSGVIHADLFHDNALFAEDGSLAGIIDFYFACNDAFLYDIAVALNDWCSDSEGQLDANLCRHYLDAYQDLRPLSHSEKALFTTMLRAGALRFWLSRLIDAHFPREGEDTHIKDPDQFKRILLQRIEAEPELQPLVA